jgi:mitochondrial fission protein ELM1
MIEIKEKIKTVWVVTEGMAGTENQCLGVAEAIGVTPLIHRVRLRFPWNILSPAIGFEQKWIFKPTLTPPWPDILIASGRKSIAVSRYIKRASGGKTFTVQIQDPRVNPDQFDLVAVPAHDPTRGDNVIVTTAAPNRITQSKLDAAVKEFPEFKNIPGPRVAVLIGGTSKSHTMTPDVISRLGGQLNALRAAGFGLMITASRRTGAENIKILMHITSPPLTPPQGGGEVRMNAPGGSLDKANIYFWDGTGPNPYHAFLAWADFIIVTSDSVSMISESLTTGKPTYIIPLPGGGRRLNRFQNNIIDQGLARLFQGRLDHYFYTTLNDSEKIAGVIKNALSLKGEGGHREAGG